MPKIIKNQGVFKKYYTVGFGIIYILLGSTYLVMESDRQTFNSLMGVFWILFGISYFGMYFYYKKKGRGDNAISWDHEKITVYEPQQKPKVYTMQEIDLLTISERNFLIKSGSAGGVMIGLENFKKEDVRLLRDHFNKETKLVKK